MYQCRTASFSWASSFCLQNVSQTHRASWGVIFNNFIVYVNSFLAMCVFCSLRLCSTLLIVVAVRLNARKGIRERTGESVSISLPNINGRPRAAGVLVGPSGFPPLHMQPASLFSVDLYSLMNISQNNLPPDTTNSSSANGSSASIYISPYGQVCHRPFVIPVD